MGYTTDFWGEVTITPPLSAELVAEINSFADEDHRSEDGFSGAEGMPGIWCQWVASEDGETLVWDEGEKFYESVLWMDYVIQRFIAPNGHVASGTICAQGEDSDDRYDIVVRDNVVTQEVYEAKPTATFTIEQVKAIKAQQEAQLKQMLNSI